jgi:hypothetical protein
MHWVAIPGSAVAFNSEGGALVINIDLALFTTAGQSTSCRPMIDGRWAGDFGGYPFSAVWTEGLNYTNFWTQWAKSRLYTGIPAGGHVLTVECTKDGSASMTVGHPLVPQSVSVLEMH